MFKDWLRKTIATRSTKYPPGTIGLEIEVEGRNLPKDVFQNWAVHDDGSLRGEDNAEYVLREPLSRNSLEGALSYLETKFKESGAVLNTESDRTSVHVHYNVQNLSWVDVMTFWCLWTVIEDLSFELCGTERRGNLFCLRVKDCEGSILSAKDAIDSGDAPFRREEYRYAGCNLQSVNKFGSIELRGMHGTADKREILSWVDFILYCFKAAAKFDNPHEVIKKFSQVGPEGFLSETLGLPRDVQRRLMTGNYRDLLWEGMRLAQDIAWIVPDWGKKEEKVYKEKVKKDDEGFILDLVEDRVEPGPGAPVPAGPAARRILEIAEAERLIREGVNRNDARVMGQRVDLNQWAWAPPLPEMPERAPVRPVVGPRRRIRPRREG